MGTRMNYFTLLITAMGSSSNVTFVRRHRGTANIGNQSLVFGPGAGGLGLGASNRTISHESINRSTDQPSNRSATAMLQSGAGIRRERSQAGGLEFANAHETGEMLFNAAAFQGVKKKFKSRILSSYRKMQTCSAVAAIEACDKFEVKEKATHQDFKEKCTDPLEKGLISLTSALGISEKNMEGAEAAAMHMGN